MSSIPNIDINNYIPPNAEKTFDEIINELKASIASGGFDPATFNSIFSGNTYAGIVEVAESFTLVATMAIPEIGWLVSGVLSLAFSALNADLTDPSSSYVILIENIVDMKIDHDNLMKLNAVTEGVFDSYKNYTTYMSALCLPPYDEQIREEINGYCTALLTVISLSLPLYLLPDEEDLKVQGLPLFFLVSAIYIQIYIEYLQNASVLGMSQSSFDANYKTLSNSIYENQNKAARIFQNTITYIRENCQSWNEWKNVTTFINGVYTGGLAKFCCAARKKYEVKFNTKIQLRNSMEMYASDIYDSYLYHLGLVTKCIQKRVSPMTKIEGYGHCGYGGGKGAVIRLSQNYIDGDMKPWNDFWEGCTGFATSGIQTFCNLDTHVIQDESFNRKGDDIPVIMKWDNEMAALCGLCFSNQVGENSSLGDIGSGSYYTMAPAGYFISSFVVICDPPVKTCAEDSGYWLSPLASVHRHWSSLEHLAVINDTKWGIELDSTCGIVMASLGNTTGFPDPLMGKNRLNIPAGQAVTFKVINDTEETIQFHSVLYHISSADDAVSINVNGSKITFAKADQSGHLIGIDNTFYRESIYGLAELNPGANIISLSAEESFSFTSLLVIPQSTRNKNSEYFDLETNNW
jgi:hypothetical protein